MENEHELRFAIEVLKNVKSKLNFLGEEYDASAIIGDEINDLETQLTIIISQQKSKPNG